MNDAEFRELISGRRRGVAATLLRGGLKLLSLPYGAGVLLRNKAFDLRVSRVFQAAVPVISVGNVTAGGTGKTPFVAYLANWFKDRGVPVALLSRGYRALEGTVNDEKLVLDRECPDVPHLQDPNRLRAAEIACREHGARLLILDDGFQHRRLHRDWNIALIDALNPWGYGNLLPRGLLREPISALKRADVVVLTRADQCPAQRLEEIGTVLRSIGCQQWVEVAFAPTELTNSSGETRAVEAFSGQPVAAFCGIGNPTGFKQTLADSGYDPLFFDVFPDHHHYTADESQGIADRAIAHGVKALLTTQKDLVKFPDRDLGGVPLWAVRIGVKVLDGGSLLQQRLESIV